MFGTRSFRGFECFGFYRISIQIRFGLDNTHNPKYHKTISIRYLCRVRIDSDSFLSDRIRFGFLGSVYLPSPNFFFQFPQEQPRNYSRGNIRNGEQHSSTTTLFNSGEKFCSQRRTSWSKGHTTVPHTIRSRTNSKLISLFI